MRVAGPERCRGIVDIAEDAAAAELERLHAAGVRGVRINVNPIKPPEPGFSMSLMKRIRTLDAKCAALGWMLDFLARAGSRASSFPCCATCNRASRSRTSACFRRWRARSSRGSWSS
jgi:hypothetical protein